MNILYCGDENAYKGICLSVTSLCRHTDKPLNIFILTASLDRHKAIPVEKIKWLEDKIKSVNPKSVISLIDITEEFFSYLPEANINTRFTPFCMLRLFADKLPQIPDKILYLDTDILCRADFSPIFNTDIKNADVAGVADRYGKWFLGNIFRHDYLNSGVLLMNMKNIRENGIFEQCRTLCREKRMFMPDQTAINKTALKLKLPVCYNEQGRIKPNTVFKHFTTFFRFLPIFHSVTVKPWDIEKLHNELKIYEFDTIIEECEEILK